MPYSVRIKDMDTTEEYKTTIEELKELKEILEKYKDKTIEVELHKVKMKEER